MRVVLWGLLLVLAACSFEDRRPVYTARYSCADATSLEVRFIGGAAEVRAAQPVLFATRTFTLAQRPAASGIWYANDEAELRGKGKQAMWTLKERRPTACRSSESANDQPTSLF